MLFVLRCLDKKNHLPVRQENRPAHVEYLQSFGEKLFAAGAILDDSEMMCGSIVIIDVADSAEASACKANQKAIEAAIQMHFAGEIGTNPSATLTQSITEVTTTNPGNYFSGGALPTCPSGGTISVDADCYCSCDEANH